MRSALILSVDDASVSPLDGDLKRAGMHVIGATTCEKLAHDAVLFNPDVVVALAPQPLEPLFGATALLESTHPVAVAIFTDDVRVELVERAFASGVHAWVIRGYDRDRLRSVLQLAQVRFRREAAHRKRLSDLTGRLEERKLVDRAKGLLMSRKGMAEEQAFRALRDAAMQGKQRLGQVAQRLIEAARAAEAVNRAGQLRMLSQRLVKLHLLGQLGIEPDSVAALRRASIERLEQNLSVLAELVSEATFGALIAAALTSWDRVKRSLAEGAHLSALREIDDAAERLLEAAEQLTAALEAASPMTSLQLVNLAGRQRMLAQRFAKAALLQGIAPEPDPAASSQMKLAVDAFDEAMTILLQSPLTARDGQAKLHEAQDVWKTLCRSARVGHLPEGRLQIAQASEELLDRFDDLTGRYELSLTVLVG